jgi:hypothetical protein
MGIAWAATRLGIDVYKPLNDGTRCDLIFDLHGKLMRVQCSGRADMAMSYVPPATEIGGHATDCFGDIIRRRRSDAFAAYCFELDPMLLPPVLSVP